MSASKYDYIVVEAGSTGCLLKSMYKMHLHLASF